MKQELERRNAERGPIALWEKIARTILGFLVLGIVAYIKITNGMDDLYFGLCMIVAGALVSTSFLKDFGAAALDRLFR